MNRRVNELLHLIIEGDLENNFEEITKWEEDYDIILSDKTKEECVILGSMASREFDYTDTYWALDVYGSLISMSDDDYETLVLSLEDEIIETYKERYGKDYLIQEYVEKYLE